MVLKDCFPDNRVNSGTVTFMTFSHVILVKATGANIFGPAPFAVIL